MVLRNIILELHIEYYGDVMGTLKLLRFKKTTLSLKYISHIFFYTGYTKAYVRRCTAVNCMIAARV